MACSPVGVPRWVATTAYRAGAVVLDQGELFRADQDVAADGPAPTGAFEHGWTAL